VTPHVRRRAAAPPWRRTDIIVATLTTLVPSAY